MPSERDLEKACHQVLMSELSPMPLLWHINDQTTGGQPDTEVAWRGHTTKIEFKKLKPGEDIHKKWEDGRQLITCVKYERATHRCWVVAYEKKFRGQQEGRTIIYRPSALLDGKVPNASLVELDTLEEAFEKLWNKGAIAVRGFTAGHRLVAALIRETHK